MSTNEARVILGVVAETLTDEEIDHLVDLYRAIARLFISKYQDSKSELIHE